MKPTKEPREKKPRVWKAWASILNGDLSFQYDPNTSSHGKYSVYISRKDALFASCGCKEAVIAVIITERKSNVQRAK
jgi:hypothetical protein